MTIRELARISGYSKTTVAYALKDNPRISLAVREKIRQLALQHGYRPNPLVKTLMQDVRGGRVRKREVAIGYVCSRGLRGGLPAFAFERETFLGAQEEADALGYQLELLERGPNGVKDERLMQILRARGVQGVFLGPTSEAHGHVALVWKRLAVISSGFSVEEPNCDRIAANIFKSVEDAIQRALARGYSPVIVALDAVNDLRVGRRWFAAAVMMRELYQDDRVIVLREPDEDYYHSLIATIREVESKPAVISYGDIVAKLERDGFNLPGDLGFVALDAAEFPNQLTSILQPHREVGQHAVSHLAMQMERGRWGLPKLPCRLALECSWREGVTLPDLGRPEAERQGPTRRRHKAGVKRSC